MITKETIKKFFEPKKIAVAGASRNPKKFGGTILLELKKKGFEVYPINPNTNEIEGIKCYKSVNELPDEVPSILIVTSKNETDSVLKSAIEKGIKNIWVQQMSETQNTINLAKEYSKEIIHHKCIFMFTEPVAGFHKFHRAILKLFGQLPK